MAYLIGQARQPWCWVCLILTMPAPRACRVKGRKISNYWANVETLGAGIRDSLFGFRVYPAQPVVRIMSSHIWMRRFDFDVRNRGPPELERCRGHQSSPLL